MNREDFKSKLRETCEAIQGGTTVRALNLENVWTIITVPLVDMLFDSGLIGDEVITPETEGPSADGVDLAMGALEAFIKSAGSHGSLGHKLEARSMDTVWKFILETREEKSEDIHTRNNLRISRNTVADYRKKSNASRREISILEAQVERQRSQLVVERDANEGHREIIEKLSNIVRCNDDGDEVVRCTQIIKDEREMDHETITGLQGLLDERNAEINGSRAILNLGSSTPLVEQVQILRDKHELQSDLFTQLREATSYQGPHEGWADVVGADYTMLAKLRDEMTGMTRQRDELAGHLAKIADELDQHDITVDGIVEYIRETRELSHIQHGRMSDATKLMKDSGECPEDTLPDLGRLLDWLMTKIRMANDDTNRVETSNTRRRGIINRASIHLVAHGFEEGPVDARVLGVLTELNQAKNANEFSTRIIGDIQEAADMSYSAPELLAEKIGEKITDRETTIESLNDQLTKMEASNMGSGEAIRFLMGRAHLSSNPWEPPEAPINGTITDYILAVTKSLQEWVNGVADHEPR